MISLERCIEVACDLQVKLLDKVVRLQDELFEGQEPSDKTSSSTPEGGAPPPPPPPRADSNPAMPFIAESDVDSGRTDEQIAALLDKVGWLGPETATVNAQRLARAAKLQPRSDECCCRAKPGTNPTPEEECGDHTRMCIWPGCSHQPCQRHSRPLHDHAGRLMPGLGICGHFHPQEDRRRMETPSIDPGHQEFALARLPPDEQTIGDLETFTQARAEGQRQTLTTLVKILRGYQRTLRTCTNLITALQQEIQFFPDKNVDAPPWSEVLDNEMMTAESDQDSPSMIDLMERPVKVALLQREIAELQERLTQQIETSRALRVLLRQCVYQKEGQAQQRYVRLQEQVQSSEGRIAQLEKTKLTRPSAPSTGSVTEQLRDALNLGAVLWNGVSMKGHELLASDHRQAQTTLEALHEWMLGMIHLSMEGRQQLRDQLGDCEYRNRAKSWHQKSKKKDRLDPLCLGLFTVEASLSSPALCFSAISWTDQNGTLLGTQIPLRLIPTPASIRPLSAVTNGATPPWVTTMIGFLQGSRLRTPTLPELGALLATLRTLDGQLRIKAPCYQTGERPKMPSPADKTDTSPADQVLCHCEACTQHPVRICLLCGKPNLDDVRHTLNREWGSDKGLNWRRNWCHEDGQPKNVMWFPCVEDPTAQGMYPVTACYKPQAQ